MSPRAKKEYTAIMAKRYKHASTKEKTKILNEYCRVTGYHRKHAIRKLNRRALRHPAQQRPGRPRIYTEAILEPLRKIWLAAHLPCGKRLKAILPLWLPSYHKTFGHLPVEVVKILMRISASSMDRNLKPLKTKYKKRGLSATRSGTLLRKQIPIKTDQWDETRPGFVESDTVHHCGESLAGHYVLTVNAVDIATTWTEQRAVFTKNEEPIFQQIKDMERFFPFAWLGFDSDNGGEFINKLLFNHFTNRPSPVQFTRSRAYHTQDNAHVEQKNNTHVRQWLGYGRFSNPEVVGLLNDLYKNEWRLYHNFFCPSVKLIEKRRIDSTIVKRYDKPKTPYQRIMESKFILPETKEKLRKQFESLNPFELRKAMDKKLEKIFQIASKPTALR
jgi:hypothetical protein